MNPIIICEVTLDDLEELQKVSKQTFFETFSSDNSKEDMEKYLNINFSKEKLSQKIKNQYSTFFMAKIDNKAIGYLKINTKSAQTELINQNSLEIERIYVLKEFLGKKVGQILYNQAIEIAQKVNAELIWLGVWEHNLRAIRFYQKNGFKAFDKHIFKLGEDEQTDILMKLTL
ncbi:GNAT family N-acetyltransferase [Carboxylicivirga linearis]|uniref:GNAT family N-acetyltransferase n=1 Tax=Carboxylicivirga linearis TaxID=1628157 RepID=A0ABS5K1G5_9BACT|nr:GNAT family N-acetyltransferase [Carboxylicivirga linearis]MBS2100986.1 GNAT family N-acetyltransferase [Carboxylicivirga linearis]